LPNFGVKLLIKIKGIGGVNMCDANAYLYENGEEELLMESVDKVVSKDSKVYLENIYGFQKMFEGRIKELLLMDHRIILENYPGKQGI
jgi:predicted RNA-binding protein